MAQIFQKSYDNTHGYGYEAPAPMTITTAKPAPPPAAAPEPTVVSTARTAMVAAREAHRAHLDELARSKDKFSPEGYRAQVNSFADSPHAQAVDAHEAAVIARRDQAAAEYKQTLSNLSPEGDTAQELRNTRAWDRHRNAIEHAESPVTAARAAIRNADDAELGVLLQELPAHLEALGSPTNWIHKDIEQRAPELASARDALHKAEQAAIVVRNDAAKLRAGFATGRPPVNLTDPGRFDPDRP